MSDDNTCQCPTCGRMHRNLGFGKPPASVMEQIARDMRAGTFPRKSEQTLQEEAIEILRTADLNLRAHGRIDAGSALHDRITAAIAATCSAT